MKDYPTIRQIVDLLLINGSLTEEPGLLHGKSGLLYSFFITLVLLKKPCLRNMQWI